MMWCKKNLLIRSTMDCSLELWDRMQCNAMQCNAMQCSACIYVCIVVAMSVGVCMF